MREGGGVCETTTREEGGLARLTRVPPPGMPAPAAPPLLWPPSWICCPGTLPSPALPAAVGAWCGQRGRRPDAAWSSPHRNTQTLIFFSRFARRNVQGCERMPGCSGVAVRSSLVPPPLPPSLPPSPRARPGPAASLLPSLPPFPRARPVQPRSSPPFLPPRELGPVQERDLPQRGGRSADFPTPAPPAPPTALAAVHAALAARLAASASVDRVVGGRAVLVVELLLPPPPQQQPAGGSATSGRDGRGGHRAHRRDGTASLLPRRYNRRGGGRRQLRR